MDRGYLMEEQKMDSDSKDGAVTAVQGPPLPRGKKRISVSLRVDPGASAPSNDRSIYDADGAGEGLCARIPAGCALARAVGPCAASPACATLMVG